jgi:hypothetical protein
LEILGGLIKLEKKPTKVIIERNNMKMSTKNMPKVLIEL